MSLHSGVRTARTQARKRVHVERQRLEVDLDFLDRFRRREFVNGRDGQNRLTLVHRFHRQWKFALRDRDHTLTECLTRRDTREILHREDGLDARHRERGARVDSRHAGMRHRAQKQLREQHALSFVVFRVSRLARHLGDEVRRRVRLSDQFVLVVSHNYAPRINCAPCIIAVRILS
jgi:hypothetical protein